jgi:hypothetical protein
MMTAIGALAACGGAPNEPLLPSGRAADLAPQASASPDAPAVAQKQKGDVAKEEAPRPDRPGLGTEWGETRKSQISMVSFERAEDKAPFAAASLFYNDAEGASAAAGGKPSAYTDMFDVAGGAVKIGLRDETGKLCTGFAAGKRNMVVGEAGHRYAIVVRNTTDRRFEVVLSVDGLDVLDGKAASFDKRGYILDPHGDLEVDGFRQSLDAVAAFRFGSVRGSYAGLTSGGDTRNVGVIGVAIFSEKGSMPFPWTPEEVRRRLDANPFPGQ